VRKVRLLLPLGVLFLGLSFFSAAGLADAGRAAGEPSWGFLLLPIGFLAVGSILIAVGVTMGVARHPRMMGSTMFLIVTGAGMGIMALILSSAFFYGCAPSECSTDTPVPANNLSIAGGLGLVGLGILTVGAASFGVSRFLATKKNLPANPESYRSFNH
jgi:hypothetical protein